MAGRLVATTATGPRMAGASCVFSMVIRTVDAATIKLEVSNQQNQVHEVSLNDLHSDAAGTSYVELDFNGFDSSLGELMSVFLWTRPAEYSTLKHYIEVEITAVHLALSSKGIVDS